MKTAKPRESRLSAASELRAKKKKKKERCWSITELRACIFRDRPEMHAAQRKTLNRRSVLADPLNIVSKFDTLEQMDGFSQK